MDTEKAHRANAFHPQEQSHFVHTDYTIVLDPGVTFEDLFRPTFWIHAKQKLKPRDRVRCIEQSGIFDVQLAVMSTPAGGVLMRFLSGDPGENIKDPFAASAAARKVGTQVKLVPISSVTGKPVVCVQFLPATKWRVIGVDGKSEVARGFASQHEAEAAMHAYLREIHMRLPTPEELAAAQPAKPQTVDQPAA